MGMGVKQASGNWRDFAGAMGGHFSSHDRVSGVLFVDLLSAVQRISERLHENRVVTDQQFSEALTCIMYQRPVYSSSTTVPASKSKLISLFVRVLCGFYVAQWVAWRESKEV